MLQCHGRRAFSRHMQRILLALVLGCTVGTAPGEARSEDNTYSAYSAYYADEQTAETAAQSAEQVGPRDGCCKSFCDECECCDWAWDAPRLLGIFLAQRSLLRQFHQPAVQSLLFRGSPRADRSAQASSSRTVSRPTSRRRRRAGVVRAIPRSADRPAQRHRAATSAICRSTRRRKRGGGRICRRRPIGFKYNFIRDVESQFIVSGGVTYFIPAEFGNFPTRRRRLSLLSDRWQADFRPRPLAQRHRLSHSRR